MTLREKLSNIREWIKHNFWNIFSFIGVLATLYLGFFYVPDYVKEIGVNKQNIVHQELISDIQELVFYDQEISIEDIKSIIHGKELVYSIEYKFSPVDLLDQVQDDFLQNKFIPLEKRNNLMNKIKELRTQYKPIQESTEHKTKIPTWVSLATGLLSALLSGLALNSIFNKLSSDKETEVDISSTIKIGDKSSVIIKNNGDNSLSAYEYESMIGDVLTELGFLKNRIDQQSDYGFDYLASINSKEYLIEVKAYTKLLGLGTAQEFAYKVNDKNTSGILIAKSGVTKRAKDLIDAHNKLKDNQKIIIISGDDKQQIKESFLKIGENF